MIIHLGFNFKNIHRKIFTYGKQSLNGLSGRQIKLFKTTEL